MFQKAEKNELKTWLLGDIIFILITLIVAVISIASIFTGGFSAGKLVWGIIFGLLAALCIFFLVKIIDALKTFDERDRNKKALEESKRLEEEALYKEKLEAEQAEMEALREQELQKREEMKAQLEALRAEKEANGESLDDEE